MLPDNQNWRIHHGDCIPHMAELPPESMDMAIFSPPFSSLYAYTSKPEDLGNSEDYRGESKLHLSFFYQQFARILKPGRVVCVHVMQIPKLKRTGETGTYDFRGLNIRLAERAGLVYCYDWLIQKNPQNEAIRTHSHSLQFASIERDRANMHGQLGDYLIKLRAPGDNEVPIDSAGQISRAEWIDWAESSWPWKGPSAIRRNLTLNAADGKGENDTKHICPLQLDVIDRAIRLYSNPGEIVFSPFAGIGSEGYQAIKLGRRFYGCEIKDEYLAAAKENLTAAEQFQAESQRDLFSATA